MFLNCKVKKNHYQSVGVQNRFWTNQREVISGTYVSSYSQIPLNYTIPSGAQ